VGGSGGNCCAGLWWFAAGAAGVRWMRRIASSCWGETTRYAKCPVDQKKVAQIVHFQSLAFQKETEPQPVAYALSLRTGAKENLPEHRFLGYWQSLIDHVEARLYHLRVDVRAQD